MTISESSIVSIAVSTIGAAAVVLAAVIPLLISTHRRAREAATDSAVTRDQVTNDHKTNMRVEADERHEAIMAQLRTHGRIMTRNTRRIDSIITRLDVVEDTLPRVPNRKKK